MTNARRGLIPRGGHTLGGTPFSYGRTWVVQQDRGPEGVPTTDRGPRGHITRHIRYDRGPEGMPPGHKEGALPQGGHTLGGTPLGRTEGPRPCHHVHGVAQTRHGSKTRYRSDHLARVA